MRASDTFTRVVDWGEPDLFWCEECQLLLLARWLPLSVPNMAWAGEAAGQTLPMPPHCPSCHEKGRYSFGGIAIAVWMKPVSELE